MKDAGTIPSKQSLAIVNSLDELKMLIIKEDSST
jgi:hypothetical protein